VGAPLVVVEPLAEQQQPVLGIGGGSFQRINAALALALVNVVLGGRVVPVPHEGRLDVGPLLASDPRIGAALAACQWPGRCQVVPDTEKGVVYYLDGAHTDESVRAAAQWFREKKGEPARAVLVFNCNEEKDVAQLLQHLLLPRTFSVAVFCPASSSRPSIAQKRTAAQMLQGWCADRGPQAVALFEAANADVGSRVGGGGSRSRGPGIAWQEGIARVWRVLHAWALYEQAGSTQLDAESLLKRAEEETETHVVGSLDEVVDMVEQRAPELPVGHHVLVCGSLYLVGDFLAGLEKKGLTTL
jgi:folylpolyglutamate synthase/dihydropteroate synthase